jgi:hypothetical protein
MGGVPILEGTVQAIIVFEPAGELAEWLKAAVC